MRIPSHMVGSSGTAAMFGSSLGRAVVCQCAMKGVQIGCVG